MAPSTVVVAPSSPVVNSNAVRQSGAPSMIAGTPREGRGGEGTSPSAPTSIGLGRERARAGRYVDEEDLSHLLSWSWGCPLISPLGTVPKKAIAYGEQIMQPTEPWESLLIHLCVCAVVERDSRATVTAVSRSRHHRALPPQQHRPRSYHSRWHLR